MYRPSRTLTRFQILIFIRLLYSRVFLKNPELIILDEPTSNLDKETTNFVIKSLISYSKDDKILIVISHDRESLKNFKSIIEIENGFIKGYHLSLEETIWTQNKAKSDFANKRAFELQLMMEDDQIDLIIPPWGGELAIEVLDKLDFSKFQTKWILGYSDTSLILLATTLKTGIATACGPNLVDLRGAYSDETTAKWEELLSNKRGSSMIQFSSENYQKEWQYENPIPCIFHLTEKTEWKTVTGNEVMIKGRLLAGWFTHSVGILFGRSSANEIIDQYEVDISIKS